MLGVERDATPEEIRAAYRRLSRTTHPDAGGSDARFRRVRTAYETLADPARRAAYDASRSGATAPSAPTASAARDTRSAGSMPVSSPRAEPTTAPTGRVGCAVAIGAAIVLVIGLGVLIAALAPSGPTVSATRASGSSIPGATSGLDPDVEAFKRWSHNNLGIIDAINASTNVVGAILSAPNGAIDGAELHAACARRNELLDTLEAAGPSPREDVKRSLHGFISSERRAMSACLSRPPDLDQMGTWGERARPDFDVVVKSMRSA